MKFIDFLTQSTNESAIADRAKNAYDISDPVDRVVAAYALDPSAKYLLDGVIDRAVQRYPNDTAITIYRGLNFDTAEQYEAFVSTIEDGMLTTNESSSWSPSPKTAMQFAKTKPSFMEFMSADMWSQIAAQSKVKERITGYRGIVLTTHIAPKTGVAMSKTGHAMESEIIIPSGTYPVTYTDVKTYKDMMTSSSVDREIAAIDVQTYGSDDDKRNLVKYMMHHHADQFNDNSKAKLFTLLGVKPFAYHIETHDKTSFLRSSPTISVQLTPLSGLADLAKFLRPIDVKKIITASKPVFTRMLNEIEQLYKPGYVIDWNQHNVGKIAEVLGLDTQYTSMLSKTIGYEYNRSTSREHNKSVKDIRGEADRILALLQSVA